MSIHASYDPASVESILAYARGLTGKSLSQVVEISDALIKDSNKGGLGELVEKYYFEIEPPNDKDPDFPLARLELKTTGLNKSKKGYFAKERLVLSLINPKTIQNETWQESTLLAKCGLMLILFYLYEENTPVHQRKFELDPMLLNILKLSPSEVNQIAKDWNYIKNMCSQNRFHELSEGQTTYLKACRKGSGGAEERLQAQAPGEPRAKSRAFSFPVSFMSSLVRKHASDAPSMLVREGQTVEDAARARLEDYLGMSYEKISSLIGFTNKSKNRNFALIKTLLSGQNVEPIEIQKAEIKLRTVTLKPNGIPRENLPFKAFDPQVLVKETWEKSSVIGDLQSRYLFAIFQESPGGLIFKKAGFWTMSNSDIAKCEGVWETTKSRYEAGNYELPKQQEHQIMFVNTHGSDSEDRIITPNGDLVTKRSFWINRHYFASTIVPELKW